MLTQESGLDPKLFCDDETLKTRDCGESEFCECIYVLSVDLNDIVEFVMIDEGVPYDVSHPFHLHGHAFHVVAMERHVANESHFGPKPFPGKLNCSTQAPSQVMILFLTFLIQGIGSTNRS